MEKPLIQISNLEKEYVNDDVVTSVLRGVNFEMNAGEFTAIMGPSGSGKSTLMHILGFLDRLTRGQYLFEGKSVNDFTDDELATFRNQKVGFIFQSFNLLSRTSVLDNVKLPMVYAGVSTREMHDRAMEAITSVGLEHRAHHFSNQLSGGEQQRVAIARALVNRPRIIFADEPTGNLDSKSGTHVMQILENLNDAGNTIILVTHEQDTADHAKRIITMRDGVVVGDRQVSNRRSARSGELRK